MATILFGSASSNLLAVSGLQEVTDQSHFPFETSWRTADGFNITAFGNDLSLDQTGTYHGTAQDIRVSDSNGNILLVLRDVFQPLLPLASGFDTSAYLAGSDAIYGAAGNDHIFGGDSRDYLFGGAGADTINTGNGDDFVLAGDGNDTVYGLQGNDDIGGNAGDDYLYGGAGNDDLYGDAGADHIWGGSGDDEVLGGDGNDAIVGETGDDKLYGQAGDDNIDGGGGNDLVSGGDGNDNMSGGTGNDKLFGDAGNDLIFGNDGDDKLDGGTGNDVLIGGWGRDVMTGGDGYDVFLFTSRFETGKTAATRDVITDFKHGFDKIDLSGIDAKLHKAGDQAFVFKGQGSAPGAEGTLKYELINLSGTAHDKTIVHGDVNGDGRDDFQIELSGLVHLKAGDFIL